MELREFLKIIKKDLWLVIVFAFIGAVGGILIAPRYSSGFKAAQTFFIKAAPIEDKSDPQSIYQAQDQAGKFTDSAVAIIESPDFLKEALGSNQSLSARKLAPLVIRLTSTSQNQSQSEAIIEQTQTLFNSKIKNLNPNLEFSLSPIGQKQPATYVKINRKIIILFGTFLGIIFGFLSISLKTYFKV